MPKQVGEELIDKLLREIMGEVSQQAQQQRFVPEYLSERQRQYFQQRTPQKQERIAMTGQTIPIPSRQQAQPQQQRPRVDVREELRQALLQNQMDVEKESRAEERKIAEEQRKSAQKEQENKQKRTQELQDKLATAQTDRERVGYQRQLAEMGAAPPPPDLTPEEIAEITQVVEVGPDRLKDIDAKQNWIRDAEHTYNLHMNDPEISPEEAGPDRLHHSQWSV